MAHTNRTRAFLRLFCARRARVRRKIGRKNAQVLAQELRVIGGDETAHAAQTRIKCCAKIARFSWRRPPRPAERAHFRVSFARGTCAFDAKSAEKMRAFQQKRFTSSPSTTPRTRRELARFSESQSQAFRLQARIFAFVLRAARARSTQNLQKRCASFSKKF